mmetsp:Transcript_13227/g.32146  ORF Transcript_13227/g.32146 Transcript_13227/m.32146 type:complete len:575 (-) Transcript_13227:46-1770(-)
MQSSLGGNGPVMQPHCAEGGGSASASEYADAGPWWKIFARRRPRSSNSTHRQEIQQQRQVDNNMTEHKEAFGGKNGWRRYHHLIKVNRNYRLYLCSHLCQHTGDWFVQVASLIAIEQLVPDSGTAISILVATEMIPMILLASFGGALADRFDRRKLMIALDGWNAAVAFLYLLALHYRSATLLYIVSFMRNSVVAIYEPVTRSIVPLLVGSDDELKCAMTMNGIAWASTLAVGGTLAGWSAATLGVGACYVVDSATYLVSAVVIWLVRGEFCVRDEGREHRGEGSDAYSAHSPYCVAGSGLSRIRVCIRKVFCPVTSFVRMFFDLLRYLSTCQFGLLVLLKATGNCTWSSADILNVHYAHVEGNELLTSTHIGIIYSSVGLGCLLGPIVANFFTDTTRPATLQMVSVNALAFIVIGWLGMATERYRSIGWLCLFNAIRAFGSSIVWINSTLLLQILTPGYMQGRMLSFDFATTMLCDTVIAFVAGVDEDAGIATSSIDKSAAALMGLMWVLWSIHHFSGQGAAKKQFNMGNESSPLVSSVKELENVGDTAEQLRLSKYEAEKQNNSSARLTSMS